MTWHYCACTGYVAVSKPDATTKKRDLAVVWRGTEAKTEWISDITCEFSRWDAIGGAGEDVDVEKGFEQLYRSFTSTPGNSLSLQARLHVQHDFLIFAEAKRQSFYKDILPEHVQGQVQVAIHKLLAKYPDIGSITTTGMVPALNGCDYHPKATAPAARIFNLHALRQATAWAARSHHCQRTT